MELAAADKIAMELMWEHGLDVESGWGFQFDHARRRFGCCNYRTRTISLSAPLTRLNDEAQVRQTLLHEIAHALVPHGSHHGPVWVKKAQEIGHTGNRCYDSNVVKRPAKKWKATCPKCGKVTLRHKRGDVACGKCCKKYNGGRYSLDYKLTFTTA